MATPQQTITTMKSQLTTLSSQITALQAQVTTLTATVAARDAEIVILKARIAVLEGTVPPPPPPPPSTTLVEEFTTVPPSALWRVAGEWQGSGGNLLQKANVAFANGQMALTVPAGSPLRGAELQSMSTTGYSYGYYVARIKPANVKNGGVVSFFWIQQPNYGPLEIDVEFTLSDSWVGTTGNGRVSFTCHPLANTQWIDLAFNPTQAFHDYGFLWTPGRVDFTVDGKIVRTVIDPSLKSTALGYIMTNAWSGIANFGGGPPTVPATSYYEWIKHYPGATAIPGTTPTPTPTPTPAPVPTGWADATNTGVPAGVTLAAYTGPQAITVAGTVVDGKDIKMALRVLAANVVIKNCRITYNDFFGISVETGGMNLTVQDCDIVGPGYKGDSPAAVSCDVGGLTFLRNEVTGAEHGLALGPGKSVVRGNYFHDGGSNKADPHIGGISLKGGQNGVLIEDNTVSGLSDATSDVFLQDNFGAINDVTINHNLLIGDPGYNIYVEGRLGNGTTNVKVTNNTLKKGHYGYMSVNQATPVCSGNVDLTGAAVVLP